MSQEEIEQTEEIIDPIDDKGAKRRVEDVDSEYGPAKKRRKIGNARQTMKRRKKRKMGENWQWEKEIHEFDDDNQYHSCRQDMIPHFGLFVRQQTHRRIKETYMIYKTHH